MRRTSVLLSSALVAILITACGKGDESTGRDTSDESGGAGSGGNTSDESGGRGPGGDTSDESGGRGPGGDTSDESGGRGPGGDTSDESGGTGSGGNGSGGDRAGNGGSVSVGGDDGSGAAPSGMGGDPSGTGGVPNQPEAQIVFPPTSSLSLSPVTTVRGTTSGNGIISLTVAGVEATSSDGFATWEAAVPTPLGANALGVEVTNADGKTDLGNLATVYHTGPMWRSARRLSLDPVANEVWVVGGNTPSLFKVNRATGHRTLVSGMGAGSGPEWSITNDVFVDPSAGRVLVLDSATGLYSVDPLTGARTLLVEATDNVDVQWSQPHTFDYDPVLKLGYVAMNNRVFEVDLDETSGGFGTYRTLSTHSGPTPVPNANAPQFRRIESLVLDKANGRLIVGDASHPVERLLAIELADGTRSVYSGEDDNEVLVPAGSDAQEDFSSPNGIALGAADGSKFFAIDSGPDGIIQLHSTDLTHAEANRTLISSGRGTPVGTGPDLRFTSDVVFDSSSGRLVATSTDGQLIEVDPNNGNRQYAIRPSHGSGVEWLYASGMSIDEEAHIAYVANESGGSSGGAFVIDAVDLGTGDRTQVIGNATGSGPTMDGTAGLALDIAGNRLFTLDNDYPGVIAIDLETHVRTLITSTGEGTGGPVGSAPVSGPELSSNGEGIFWDATNGRLLLLDPENDSVLAVDPTSGARTILSHEGTQGAGPGLGLDSDLGAALDDDAQVLYVGCADDEAIFKVDLATGDRTSFSDSSHAGEDVLYPGGLALDLGGGQLYALNTDNPFTHHQINLLTGDRIDRTPFHVPSLDNPSTAHFVSSTGLLYVLDNSMPGLMVYDTTTWNVVILSR